MENSKNWVSYWSIKSLKHSFCEAGIYDCGASLQITSSIYICLPFWFLPLHTKQNFGFEMTLNPIRKTDKPSTILFHGFLIESTFDRLKSTKIQ